MSKDFSRMTNEELQAIVGQQAPAQQGIDFASLSDQELEQIAAEPKKPSLLERLGRAGIPKGGTGILPSKESLATAGEFVSEFGPGLGELGAGAVQLGAEVLGQEGFAKRIGQQVEKGREGLTTAQKAGRVGGQIIGTAPIAAGGTLLSAAIKSAGAISALTPTEEGTAEAKVKQIGTGVATSVATLGAIKGGGKLVSGIRNQSKEAIKRVKSGLVARTIQELEEGSVALKTKSQDVYAKMRELNSDINPKAGTKLVTQLDKALTDSGKLNQKLHGDTMSVG